MKHGVALAFVLALSVGAGSAAANAPKSAPRITVVKIMTDSGQALVLDRNRGEYVVVRTGDSLTGFVVSTVDDDQIVLTTSTEPPTHYVFPLIGVTPTPAPTPAPAPATPMPIGGAATGGIADPYATEPPPASGPLFGWGTKPVTTPSDVADPYAEQPPTTVLAPEGSRVEPPTADEPSDPVDPPLAPAPPTSAGKTGDASKIGSSKQTPEPVTSAAKPTDLRSRLTRTFVRDEFESAMSDFQARSKEISVKIEDRGVRVVSVVSGSFFARLGLQKNDLILSVAGHQVRDADEAAVVYVELSRGREFDVVVERAGSRMTIHVEFSS